LIDPITLISFAKIDAIFGVDTFGDKQIRNLLPEDKYKCFRQSVDNGEPLEGSVANEVRFNTVSSKLN
jgi:glutamine synthetase type III